MSQESNQKKPIGPAALQFSINGDHPGLEPWTEIEDGRFMPRRVRGSCQGRALGWVFTVPSSGSDDAECSNKESPPDS